MGVIRDNVFLSHLSKYPHEKELLIPFLANFDITYGQRKTFRGTQLSVLFLEPDKTIQDQFGITSEILLAISDYATVQARAIQAIDDILSESPARGRVDQTLYFFVTKSEGSIDWIANYAALNPQSRIPIVMTHKEMISNKSDPWFIRSCMSQQLFSRDMFNEQLPLINDLFFFGRDPIVAEFLSSAKLAQNKGLFGLRKTGKTSILYKFKRLAETEGLLVLYYDCKDPSIRSLSWIELLSRITTDILVGRERNVNFKNKPGIHVSDRFKQVVKSATSVSNICIIFDEIEYISPIAKLDLHWHNDFIPFWQTIWTTQSQTRKLSFVVAGVNPRVVELDIVAGVQNPIFGILAPRYLTGLSFPETRAMLYQFGKRMGLRFDHDSCVYMFERFGGHPLLTRMAGSFINSSIAAKNLKRPVNVTRAGLEQDETEREQELSFYCRHVTSELKVFYPDEYEMLEMLASGNEADFLELSQDPQLVMHLKHYGLVNSEKGVRPGFKIPVLGRFINEERLRGDKDGYEFFSVKPQSREPWLRNRVRRITDDSRTLEAVGRRHSLAALYGSNGFPEAERFAAIEIVRNRSGFESFITTCNRCFVESIEVRGREAGKRNYFWEDVKNDFPHLWDGLIRVKLYRNNSMHLELYDRVDAQLRTMLERDLRGRSLGSLQEPYFVLQQVVLDGLFVGFQLEIDRFS